jgi:hypothetical protein
MNHTPDPILKWAALGAALLAGSLPLHAVQAERQTWDNFADWAEGTAKGVAIEEPGRLVPAQVFTRAAGLDAAVVWTAAPGLDGSILAGTGGKGRVFRVARNGTASLLTEFTEPDVYAVAAGPRGEIYAAPSPGGKIFRRNAQGVFEEYFATGETYVWDLKVAPNGTLYAATGTQGKIFRITGAGRGEVWFDADEPHIRRLLLDGDGALLAGSAGKGLVYRILQKDRGIVLLDSGKEEITALALGPDQAIYAAAVANPGGSGAADRPRSVRIQPSGGGGLAVVAEGSPVKPGGNGAPASGGPGPASRAACDLYVIEGDFYPRRLRELKDDILSLAHDGRRLLAGSGSAGKLYQVNQDGEFAALGQIDAESVAAITAGEGGVRLVTSGPSAVWSATTSAGGAYTSKPVDSKLFARWGALRLAGQGEWRVRTRSGNTSDPDKSWHPWLPLDGDKVASPAARYLQIEIALVRGQVEHAELFFLPQNQPPRFESLRVLAPGVAYEPIQQPSPPPQPQTPDQLVKSPDGPPPQPVRFQPIAVRGARTVVWQAQDPNGDVLDFEIQIRREGESAWELLEGRLEQPVFSWDTTAWPDGAYRVRVRATDAPGNAATDALDAEKTSAIFTIDHTPPTLTLRRQTSTSVELDAVDATSPIAAAYVSTNGFDFKPMLPQDGICDSRREVFQLTIEAGKGLFLRVEDSHGNVAGWRLPAPAPR